MVGALAGAAGGPPDTGNRSLVTRLALPARSTARMRTLQVMPDVMGASTCTSASVSARRDRTSGATATHPWPQSTWVVTRATPEPTSRMFVVTTATRGPSSVSGSTGPTETTGGSIRGRARSSTMASACRGPRTPSAVRVRTHTR